MVRRVIFIFFFLFNFLLALDIDNIDKLLSIKTTEIVNVKSFHKGLNKGGGEFYFDSLRPQLEHNGATVIAKGKIFPKVWDNKSQVEWYRVPKASKKGCWVRKDDSNGMIRVESFGAIGGRHDDYRAIQKTIQYANKENKVIRLEGMYGLSSTLNFLSNIKMLSFENSELVALENMPIMLKIKNKKNITFEGLIFNGNHKVRQKIVSILAGERITITHCFFKNWTQGVIVNSSKAKRSKDILIENNFFYKPTKKVYNNLGVIYPIQINNIHPRKLIKNVIIQNNTIYGNGGAYSSSNNSTADQIALQGVEYFKVLNNVSEGGGEVGITASRLSRNGIIHGNTIMESDSDGIVIGGAYVRLVLNNTENFHENDIIRGADSGAIVKIQTKDKSSLYCISAKKAIFKKNEFLYIGNKKTNMKVNDVDLTRNIEISGNIIYSNGKNMKNLKGAWAGIKLQMTERISIFNNYIFQNKSKNQGSVWGIYLVHSKNIFMKYNKFHNNKSGEISRNGQLSYMEESKSYKFKERF